MASADSFEDLIAWQEAMRLVELVYQCTSTFPRQEVFGLSAQMRRAAVSIPCNIAEGTARNSSRELLQFLGIANGSVAELRTQLRIAIRLGFLGSDTRCIEQASRVSKLITGLRNSIRSKTG